MTKRIFALLLCVATLLASLSFAGCSSEKKDEDRGQYITAYLTDNVYDLDPAKAYTNEALSNVVSLMFDTLFTLDDNGKVKNALAEKYVINENKEAKEYSMQIYLKDTNWSDGTPVSANDVVFAWKRLLEVDANYEAAALLFDIKNARAAKEGDASIDDVGIYPAEQQMLEIQFEGKIDYEHFIRNLTSLALAPLREDSVTKSDDWAKKPGTMVCSGPFKLARVNVQTSKTEFLEDPVHVETDEYGYEEIGGKYAAQRITDFMLERNVYYYRNAEKDKLDKSVTPYRISVDCSLTDEQLLGMYEAGMVMYISDVPLALRKEGAIADDAELAEKSMSTNSIYFNQNAWIDNGTEEGEQLFAKKEVRQALSMVIDRAAIAEAIVYAEAATGLIPSGVFEAGNRKKTFRDACTAEYATLSTDMDSAESDAKALLDKAKVNPKKYSFSLSCAAYDEVHCAIAESIAASWKKLGFDVTVKKLGTIQNNDWYKHTASVPLDICDDLYAEEFREGRFEAILFDYVAYSVDPYSVLAPFAKAFTGRGMDMSNPDEYVLPTHITGFDNADYNELMEKIYAEKTIANRADDYREAEKILMDEMPIVPVIFNIDATVTSSKLKKGDTDYYNTLNFQKCKISSYDKYLQAGFEYLEQYKPEDVDDAEAMLEILAFTQSNDCAYTSWSLLVDSNTIYTHFFLEEKARLEALEDAEEDGGDE